MVMLPRPLPTPSSLQGAIPPRAPDYVTFTGGFGLPGGAGASAAITIDRFGKVYVAPGGGVGAPDGKGWATQAGWLRNDATKSYTVPMEQDRVHRALVG